MQIDEAALKLLYWETDTALVRSQIRRLVKRRFPVARKTPYHIKIYDVNFYLPRERITIDPSTRHPHRGFDALLELLEKMYPRPLLAFDFSNDD